MTVRTRSELNSDADSALADNSARDISAADVRQRVKDVADSAVLPEDIGVSVQAYDADLGAVAGVSSTGLLARTGAGTASARSIAVTSSTGVSITNGDGVSGNPTLAGIGASTTVKGVAEIAVASEYRTATDTTRVLGVAEVWAAAALGTLTDAATITVDFSTGFNLGGASDAVLALGGNRTLGAPSNAKKGQAGILWFGASSSTRTLTLHANWLLCDGVEVGPYSITTAQELGVAYVVRNTRVYVTGILRSAA